VKGLADTGIKKRSGGLPLITVYARMPRSLSEEKVNFAATLHFS
jgi:hypothetical protein